MSFLYNMIKITIINNCTKYIWFGNNPTMHWININKYENISLYIEILSLIYDRALNILTAHTEILLMTVAITAP